MTIKDIYCKSLWVQLFLTSVIGILVYNASVYAENEEDWMPDPALREAVREKLSIPANSPLTQAYMREHLTNLEARDKGIVNLTGLELATDLRVLGLSRNKISNLSPLSSLTELGYLVLDDNQISDLSPLAGLPNLEVLRLRSNQITDVSPLAGLVNLKVLSVSHNQISDLSPLAGLPNLENLWTEGNLDKEFPPTLPVSDAQEAHWMPDPALRKAVRERMGIPPNRTLTQADLQEHLTGLHAINKGIVDLTGLEHATDLQSLGLPRNKISDLSPLSGLTGLVWLNLGTNQISDLRPLAALTRLELLGLADNQIEDLSPLAGLVNLKDLNINGNPIMRFRPFKNSQIYFDDLLDLLRCEMPRLPIGDRISNREYPSTFAFGKIINLPNVDERDLETYHDLRITGARYGMRWYDTEDGRRLIIGNSKHAQNVRQELISRNPNLLLLNTGALNFGADPGVYPEDFPFWLRDENGDIIYSKEWDSYLMDMTLPAVQDWAVQRAVAIEACGYDGIWLDEWNEKAILDRVEGRTPPDNAGIFRGVENEFETRMTMLRRIREAVSDDFLILVNSGADKIPHSAPYVNGMFMETIGSSLYGYNHQQLIQIENTLLWGERNLREPRINCLRGTGLNREPLDTPKNQQWMRLFTTLSLTHSDGYVVLTTGIEFGHNVHKHAYEIWPGHSDEHARGVDHSHNQQHYWYDFYDAPLGRPIGGDETKGQHYVNGAGETIEGLFIREFTNGWAVYNRSGTEQTITLPMETTGVASGITATRHTVPDLDGEMFLKHGTGTSADVNGDGVVNVLDLVLVAQHLGETAPSNSKVDVNGDGIVNILDLILIAQHLGGEMAAAPAMVSGAPDAAVIQAWIKQAQLENDGSIAFQRGIVNLQRLLASLIPEKTVLLANYPNPFNPETWIPYHLANPSDVRITIYDTRGSIIQRLELGHQQPGYYVTKNRAAYWNGRNEVGERVANGIYFYQLQADQVSVLRKMVMLK